MLKHPNLKPYWKNDPQSYLIPKGYDPNLQNYKIFKTEKTDFRWL